MKRKWKSMIRCSLCNKPHYPAIMIMEFNGGGDTVYLCSEHCLIHWVDREVGSGAYSRICGGSGCRGTRVQRQVRGKVASRKRISRKPRGFAGHFKVGKGK